MEMKKAVAKAFKKGKAEGFDIGFDEGFFEAYDIGYKDALDEGYVKGKTKFHIEEDLSASRGEGYGNVDDYMQGFDDGDKIGYERGKAENKPEKKINEKESREKIIADIERVGWDPDKILKLLLPGYDDLFWERQLELKDKMLKGGKFFRDSSKGGSFKEAKLKAVLNIVKYGYLMANSKQILLDKSPLTSG